MRYLVVFTLLSFSSLLLAQKEENIWYFGDRAGINFNTSPPTALTDGVINTNEGVATISDSDGNLLFYTDGSTIWNRNHGIMDNGTDLGGNSTTTQSGVIVPRPQNPNIYYVFSVGCEAGIGGCATGYTGLQYAVVDMSQDGGLGSVTSKDNRLENTTTEKLTGVFHANEKDIWVITHQHGNSIFNVYSITSAGINTTPNQHNVGSVHKANAISTIGYMKISPNGRYLVVAVWGDNFIEVFDFNRSTGVISNPRRVNVRSPLGNLYRPYGLEFSPDSRYLYSTDAFFVSGFCDPFGGRCSPFNTPCGGRACSLPDETRLIRYDITAADIQGSAEVLATRANALFGALQLASNQNIYFSFFGQTSLHVIENSNLVTPTISYNAISLNRRTTGFGLPNFIRGFSTHAEVTNICEGDNTRFEIVGSLTPRTATWNFGDGSPVVAGLTPTHRYPAAGDYSIVVDIDFTTGASETINQDITIDKSEPTLAPFPDACQNGPPIALTQGSPAGGTYSGTGIVAGTNTFDGRIVGAGTFPITYTYTNSNGCVGTVSRDIEVVPPQLITLNADAVNTCTNRTDALTAFPAGGTFSGPGVVGNQFLGRVAGVGSHVITYRLNDACKSSKTAIYRVQAPLSAELPDDTTVCNGDAAFNIKHRFTGTFTGRGITDRVAGTFDPAVAGAWQTYNSFQLSRHPCPCPLC